MGLIMRQQHMIINGTKYIQGMVFVVKSFGGQEQRMTFGWYDTERKWYRFIFSNAASASNTISYPDTRFMNDLIRIDNPTETELKNLQAAIKEDNYYHGRSLSSIFSSDNMTTLYGLGLIALFTLSPPIGLIVLLCIVFSNGKSTGFWGCLSSVVILALIAMIYGIFS